VLTQAKEYLSDENFTVMVMVAANADAAKDTSKPAINKFLGTRFMVLFPSLEEE
jgi:hypothetical protein